MQRPALVLPAPGGPIVPVPSWQSLHLQYPSQVNVTRSICSSSESALMSDVSSSTTGSSLWSSSTAASRSSEGFDAGSGSVTASFTSNSLALRMMKHTVSGEIVSGDVSSAAGVSGPGDLACTFCLAATQLFRPNGFLLEL